MLAPIPSTSHDPDDTPFCTPMADQDDDPIADAINNDATPGSRQDEDMDMENDTSKTRGSTEREVNVQEISDRVAEFLNEIKNALREKGEAVSVSGTIHLRLQKEKSRNLQLHLVEDRESDASPVQVRVEHAKTPGHAPLTMGSQYTLDDGLSQDVQPRRKRRRLYNDAPIQSLGPSANGEDSAPLSAISDAQAEAKTLFDMTSDDMERMFSEAKDDIQADTVEAVNHTNRLLRKFHEQWLDHVTWLQNRRDWAGSSAGKPNNAAHVNSEEDGQDHRTMVVPLHSPTERTVLFPDSARDGSQEPTTPSSPPPVEARVLSTDQLSKQIKWVEECRRIASEAHDRREETWRSSSTNFHFSARRERERFETHMFNEMGAHTKMLANILNEVKTLGNLTYSLKWETPGHNLFQQPVPTPYPPAPATKAGSTPTPTPTTITQSTTQQRQQQQPNQTIQHIKFYTPLVPNNPAPPCTVPPRNQPTKSTSSTPSQASARDQGTTKPLQTQKTIQPSSTPVRNSA